MTLLLCSVVQVYISTATASTPSGSCRLLLLKAGDNHPLAGQEITLMGFIEGTPSGNLGTFKADADGIVELAKPFQEQIAPLIERYHGRIHWRASTAQEQLEVDLADCAQRSPVSLSLQTGDITISGHFEDIDGNRVSYFRDLVPVAVRDFLSPHDQRTLYVEFYSQLPSGKAFSRNIYADENGQFTVTLPNLGTYRLAQHVQSDGYHPAVSEVTVESPDQPLVITVAANPYCLYGSFIDAADGSPTKEALGIGTLTNSFFNPSKSPRYALFFDEPGVVELSIGDSPYQHTYAPQKVQVALTEKLQRHDFRLVRTDQAQGAIKLHVEIEGVLMVTESHLDLHIHGEGDYRFTDWKRGNSFDVLLPKPGLYGFSVSSQEYEVEPIERVLIDRDQELRLHAVPRNTWLKVRIMDKQGKPLGFPMLMSMHEPAINTVALFRNPNDSLPQPYALIGVGDFDIPLRPNEQGEVQFRIAKGGNYYLQTLFKHSGKRIIPVTLTTGETTQMEIRLEERAE